jgi:hypothetical protein
VIRPDSSDVLSNRVTGVDYPTGGLGIRIQPIAGLSNILEADARAIEEAVVSKYGTSRDPLSDGSSLLNRYHSISPSRSCYTEWLERGIYLLTSVGGLP